jgi:hypothetical protein
MQSLHKLSEDVTGPRYIDPNAPLAKQIAVLTDLIKNPPENSRVIVFSPSLAEWVLDERNPRNRKLKPARIKRYAEAMAEDAWLLTGETIIFSKEGLLLDGQNRMAASLRSGKAFRTHVVFGIRDGVFVALNSGKARTPSDTFLKAGAPHPEIVAPCIRWLMIYATGNPSNRALTFSNQEMWEFYKTRVDHNRLALAVERTINAIKMVPRGTLAAHFYLFDQQHAPTAKRFADDAAKGIRGFSKLAAKLTHLRKQNMGRMQEAWLNALLVQTWNAYRAGQTVTAKHLNWHENKEYPTIA